MSDHSKNGTRHGWQQAAPDLCFRHTDGIDIMTGYTVHTGSNDNFREGWDQIFSGGKKKKTSKGSKTRAKKTASPKKKAGRSTKKKR